MLPATRWHSDRWPAPRAQLYDLETTYFHDAGQGNVLKGFEGYLALNKHAKYASAPPPTMTRVRDRPVLPAIDARAGGRRPRD